MRGRLKTQGLLVGHDRLLSPVVPAQAGIQNVEFRKPLYPIVSVHMGLDSRLRGNDG